MEQVEDEESMYAQLLKQPVDNDNVALPYPVCQ